MEVSSTIFESLVCFELELNPGLLGLGAYTLTTGPIDRLNAWDIESSMLIAGLEII